MTIAKRQWIMDKSNDDNGLKIEKINEDIILQGLMDEGNELYGFYTHN